MGKLLVGHYGSPPDAESITISLKDCHQRLSLKPSDFVSEDEPGFFKRKQRALGKYLVFHVETTEVRDAAVWRSGYYLLPLEAADVLRSFSRQDILRNGEQQQRPVEVQSKQPLTADVEERALRWASQSQPLLFQCHCPQLILIMDAPSFIRRHWRLRLTCRKRCQPPVKAQL